MLVYFLSSPNHVIFGKKLNSLITQEKCRNSDVSVQNFHVVSIQETRAKEKNNQTTARRQACQETTESRQQKEGQKS